jgi:threonine dehydrogenase-like Zn-dependent dehydrogenase
MKVTGVEAASCSFAYRGSHSNSEILLMGRHQERTNLGREFGAADVIAERGHEGIQRVRELTGGDGTRAVLECVGTRQALEQGSVIVL